MLSSTAQLRLQQLEDNVARVLKLLNDYETELIDEVDPGTRSKYQRRIENLRQQKDSYESELTAFEEQLKNTQSEEKISIISSDLQKIDEKLNWLAGSQITLHEFLLKYFTSEEISLINPLARQLNQTQLGEVKSVLEMVESDQISDEEIVLTVAQVQQILENLRKINIELPNGNKEIAEILNQPTVDAKHALKVSVPIIPFILAYEGELGLGAGIKLRETWNYWKTRLFNR